MGPKGSSAPLRHGDPSRQPGPHLPGHAPNKYGGASCVGPASPDAPQNSPDSVGSPSVKVPKSSPRARGRYPRRPRYQRLSARWLEPAGDQESPLHFRPAGARERRHRCAEKRALSKADVVEVQRAKGRHPVVRGQDHFGLETADRARDGYDDDFVQRRSHPASRARRCTVTSFVGSRERVSADLTAAHRTRPNPLHPRRAAVGRLRTRPTRAERRGIHQRPILAVLRGASVGARQPVRAPAPLASATPVRGPDDRGRGNREPHRECSLDRGCRQPRAHASNPRRHYGPSSGTPPRTEWVSPYEGILVVSVSANSSLPLTGQSGCSACRATSFRSRSADGG